MPTQESVPESEPAPHVEPLAPHDRTVQTQFEDHLTARAAMHLGMPLTLRRKVSTGHIQRSVAPVPTPDETPAPASTDVAGIPANVPETPAEKPLLTPPAPTATPLIQRRLQPSAAAGTVEDSAEPLPNLPEEGPVRETPRHPLPAPAVPTPPPAVAPAVLLLRAPHVQRQAVPAHAQPAPISVAPVILPQVREALGQASVSTDAVAEDNNQAPAAHVTAAIPASIQRHMALNTRLPLVQRKLNPAGAVSVTPSVERIQREEGEESLPLVKKPQPQGKSEEETHTEPPENKLVEPEPPQQAHVNLDQLARDIYPLVRRMLNVERERVRGR